MSAYSEFFLKSKSSVVELECLTINHVSFSTAYCIVRNATNGVTVKHEDGVSYLYTYYPLAITKLGSRGDLDQGLRISFGDLGEIIPNEIDSITSANTFGIKPVVEYRTYRSDNLESPMFGPLRLEIKSFSFTREGSTFEASAPELNINKTGELYKIDRFYPLRGLL
jgi:hypothetical protein